MEVVFQAYQKRHAKLPKLPLLVKGLSKRESFSLLAADNELKRLVPLLAKKSGRILLEFCIFEQEEALFRSEILITKESQIHLLLLVEELLDSEFPEESKDEKKELMEQLIAAYEAEKSQPVEELPNQEESTVEVSEEEQEQTSIFAILAEGTDQSERAFENSQQSDSWIEPTKKEHSSSLSDRRQEPIQATKGNQRIQKRPVRKTKPSNEKREKPARRKGGLAKRRDLESDRRVAWRKIVWILGISLLFAAGSVGILFKSGLLGTANQVPSYETLIKKKNYDSALEEYPKKEKQLVTLLYKKQDKQSLKKLATAQHSDLAYFYLTFLKEDWEEVTKMTDIPQDATVQAMKGYAYLQEDQLTEAEIINRSIHSDVLAKQIVLKKKDLAYEAIHQENLGKAEEINNEIEDKQLTEDLVVAKSTMDLLKKYQADMRNTQLSVSDQQEAKENYQLWRKNLQQIGH